MSKNRSKSGSKKKRQKKYGGPGTTKAESEPVAGGVMQGMTDGFRRAVGVQKKKKPGTGSKIWTALLLIALAAIVYWRFFR